jgi:hypothetical protein
MKFTEEMNGIVKGKLLVTLLPADGITKAIYAGGHFVREHQQRRENAGGKAAEYFLVT